jgi:hypothetical protein
MSLRSGGLALRVFHVSYPGVWTYDDSSFSSGHFCVCVCVCRGVVALLVRTPSVFINVCVRNIAPYRINGIFSIIAVANMWSAATGVTGGVSNVLKCIIKKVRIFGRNSCISRWHWLQCSLYASADTCCRWNRG